MSKTSKTMTLRLESDRAAEIEAIVRTDGVSISDAVRDAIDNHIEMRKNDKEFQDRLKQLVERERDVLDRLAK